MVNPGTTHDHSIDPEDWERIAAASAGSVLLRSGDPSAEDNKSYLFTAPIEILSTRHLHAIPDIFDRVESALRAGHYVAGFLSYEAGYHFEPAALGRGQLLPKTDLPLAWFGVYETVLSLDRHDSSQEPIVRDEETTVERGKAAILLSSMEYRSAIDRIRHYIEAGDLYQANFTMKIRQTWNGDVNALFKRIMANQPVPYGAFINTGETLLLSASPELFFRRRGNEILVRPMKGTARRGRDLTEDAEAAAQLASDDKNRAENIMVVDLLRNDMGRLCITGTVQARDLFAVARYPDLLQMTSTVCGVLPAGTEYYEIFRSLFPCGSITGAPKIRTMQVIRELEDDAREIACGAIGFFAPDDRATFSVAIRTMLVRSGTIEMRVGSGVTYDSDADSEYDECLLKSQFLFRRPALFEIIETLLWDADFVLLDLHLQRMADSAEYFNFRFDTAIAKERLYQLAASFTDGCCHRIRMLLSRSGAISITSTPIAAGATAASILIAAEHTHSADVFLRHKTTRRALYDRTYAEGQRRGFDDVLFMNERDEVTECAIHNLMVERDGVFVTPAVSCGLLPGVFRRHLMESRPEICEGVLTLNEVLAADKVFIFNSVRGLTPVHKIQA
jgi:para-aminobenzoate synthetase/4-amino-4-deoxychorismate lyase